MAIVVSPFVGTLFELIKEQVEECKGSLTSESFLIGLAEADAKGVFASFGDEAAVTKKRLLESFPDLCSMKDGLLSFFSQEQATLMYAKVTFQQKISAVAQDGQTVTADKLLERILLEPSRAIAELMTSARAAVPTAENAAKSSRFEKSDAAALIDELKTMRQKLLAKVRGQDNAVQTFVSGYFEAVMMAKIGEDRSHPLASYLFAGPPGVGKTFLAENIAEALGDIPYKRFDMSEYADKEAHLEMCGFDQAYRGAKEGNLTQFVRENPRCVLLFDEVEKAHLVVIHLFLQLLDAGRLRDNYTDKEVSFSDAVVIFTTNAGKQLYESSETEDMSAVSRKAIIQALQKDVDPLTERPYFPAAICSRFASGNVVMFNHMPAHELCNIAQDKLKKQAEDLQKHTGIAVRYDEQLTAALLFSQGSAVDARVMNSRAEALFSAELYELMRLVDSEKVETAIEDLQSIDFRLDLEAADPSIRAYFCPPPTVDVLAVCGEDTLTQCRKAMPSLTWHAASSAEEAKRLFKSRDIRLVLLDMHEKSGGKTAHLNIEDVDSAARQVLVYMTEKQTKIPVYLLNVGGAVLDEEEKVSFRRRGVRGVVELSASPQGVAAAFDAILREIHRNRGVENLVRQNKLLSFETAQSLSEDGKQAVIRLYDFKLSTAVDAEDTENILSALSMPEDVFDDVIGADEAKKELMYFVNYLKNPKRYAETGVKAPKGVLMYGPPGTGKTMLARAMAHEAGVTFLASEGNMFLKGPDIVHRYFRTARKYAPAVLFVDEIDAIARERTGFGGVEEKALTAFLTEMDGFRVDPDRPVFVLAATNFDVTPGSPKSLDGALMRRFDRRILVDVPDRASRRRFLEKKREENPALQISDDVIESIALRAVGMSPAALDSVVELSLRSAIRAGSMTVNDEIFEEAFENFNNGEKKEWDSSLLERVARHEAGHALLYWLGGETPSYLTVVARDGHGGYMQHGDREGRPLYTKEELLSRIRTALGGRAAECVCYGPQDGLSTGAAADLEQATYYAREMVCAYGMTEEIGLAVWDRNSVSSVPELRQAINALLSEQMQRSKELIEQHRDKLDRLVAALVAKNHLTGAEIERVLKE